MSNAYPQNFPHHLKVQLEIRASGVASKPTFAGPGQFGKEGDFQYQPGTGRSTECTMEQELMPTRKVPASSSDLAVVCFSASSHVEGSLAYTREVVVKPFKP